MDRWQITLNLGDKIPGKELMTLLEKIDETGSLNRAVDEAGFSYRYGWGLLNRAEDAFGKALVSRQAGGSAGGGTKLTPEGKKLLGHMQSLQREVQGQLSSLLAEKEGHPEKSLMLASTMEPVVTGLLEVLEQAYLQETGVIVRHIAAGSGQAVAMAKAGRVDVILTHAPELEEAFVRDGWGVRRVHVMSNDFLIVGPPDNPAGIASRATAVEAFRLISESGARFVSRGDQSGTHLSEQNVWIQAGIDPVGQDWYSIVHHINGNYGILRCAAELSAYTLVDRASFVAAHSGESLRILSEGDPLLQNIFTVMPVSRKKAAVNQAGAERLSDWLCSSAARKIIAEFGMEQYGVPLFAPVTN